MGTEAGWVPLVVSLVAAGAQQYNTSQTAKRRDEDIARGIRETGKTQDKADQQISRNLDDLEKSRSQPFKDDLTQQFLEKIKINTRRGVNNLDTEGSVSDAFREGSANAKTGAVDYAGRIASLLAGVDAAGNQRQSEKNARGDLGLDLTRFKRDSSQESFLAQLRASRHRDNPWLAIAASGAQGYASGMAGGGFGGSSGAPPNTGVVNPNGVTFPARAPSKVYYPPV